MNRTPYGKSRRIPKGNGSTGNKKYEMDIAASDEMYLQIPKLPY